jgi:hypothetical protein
VVPPAGGLFASSTEYLSGAFASPQAIAAADFNGDGVVDLVTVNSTGSAALFLADGAGGFSLAGTFPTGGSAPWSVAVGDFNGDGHADLAVANTGSSNVGILLGNGAGGFAPAVTYATGGFSPWYLTVGDFNGDGNDDWPWPIRPATTWAFCWAMEPEDSHRPSPTPRAVRRPDRWPWEISTGMV